MHALADPVRRGVIDLLGQQPTSAGEIAQHFDMSLPAMSRQLRMLRQNGLIEDVRDEADARVRVYQLKPERLAELGDWLSELESFWSGQLGAFKQFAERQGGKEK